MMFAALVYPVLEPKGVLLDELLVVEPLPDKGIGNPQCQDAVCPRHDRDPMVRFDRRRRPSRVHLNEPPARARSTPREAAEANVVGSSVRLDEPLPERIPIATVLPPEDRHGVREAPGSEVRQPGGHHFQRLAPSDGAEASPLPV